MKFKKKPVEIEAVQWNGDNLLEVYSFIKNHSPDITSNIKLDKWQDYEEVVRTRGLKIQTLEGEMSASVNDWIIKGVHGEFYPCKPDIFELTYELA